jgi:hypothetical protein
MLRAFVSCAEAFLTALTSDHAWGNGVYKTPQLINFPSAKGGTKTIAHLSIGCLIRNLKTRRRSNTLKGSQRTGCGQNALKNLRASPFNKDLSNETTFSPIHLAGQYL